MIRQNSLKNKPYRYELYFKNIGSHFFFKVVPQITFLINKNDIYYQISFNNMILNRFRVGHFC